MLALLLAAQWLLASPQGLQKESDGSRTRRQFEMMIRLQPVSFAVSIALVFIAPGQAMLGLAATQAIVNLASRRAAARR